MADGDVVSDDQRSLPGHMAHAKILNICAFTNADFSDISPENRLKPD
jgi:hypothetical protein